MPSRAQMSGALEAVRKVTLEMQEEDPDKRSRNSFLHEWTKRMGTAILDCLALSHGRPATGLTDRNPGERARMPCRVQLSRAKEALSKMMLEVEKEDPEEPVPNSVLIERLSIIIRDIQLEVALFYESEDRSQLARLSAARDFVFLWDIETLDSTGSPHFENRENLRIDQICIRFVSSCCPAANAHELVLNELAEKSPQAFVRKAWPQITKFVREHTPEGGTPVLISHNAKFDTRVLLAAIEGSSTARDACGAWLFACSIQVLQRAVPGRASYSLAALCEDYEIQNKKAHDARHDVDALFRVLDKIVGIQSLADKTTRADEDGRASTLTGWALAAGGVTLLTPNCLNKEGVYAWVDQSNKYHSQACKDILDESSVQVGAGPPLGYELCELCEGIEQEKKDPNQSNEPPPHEWWITTSSNTKVYHAYPSCKRLVEARSKEPLTEPPADKRICKICLGRAVGTEDRRVLDHEQR